MDLLLQIIKLRSLLSIISMAKGIKNNFSLNPSPVDLHQHRAPIFPLFMLFSGLLIIISSSKNFNWIIPTRYHIEQVTHSPFFFLLLCISSYQYLTPAVNRTSLKHSFDNFFLLLCISSYQYLTPAVNRTSLKHSFDNFFLLLCISSYQHLTPAVNRTSLKHSFDNFFLLLCISSYQYLTPAVNQTSLKHSFDNFFFVALYL